MKCWVLSRGKFKRNPCSISTIANELFLISTRRYNPDHLKTMEAYVMEQAETNTYDLEANLAVLKLYQFNPPLMNVDVTCTILLKCITNLPQTDFVMAKCLLLSQQIKNSTIQIILDFGDMLERADFIQFWQKAELHQNLFRHVTGFYDSIRKFVSHVVNITFQNIRKETLRKLMGGIDDTVLDNWIKKYGWENRGELVFIAAQDERIKTKNITEKIEFDHLGNLMAHCL